ncbi:MAG TPA: cytochrome c oxidase assembly factor Coa1 family protein [Pyrinomonadaceae bacterium]|jgi:hypothetical protein|nr:cytochrome c oxidase assembly factor Coa1 family protein [Pyrinomonadaceae bacterium]
MTTKRLIFIIAGVLSGIALLVALFVGVISGIVLYSINKSDAAATARSYLRGNEKLKRETGEVKDFGSLVTGNLNTRSGEGDATIRLKVIGERRTVNAEVALSYRRGSKWWVTDASYVDEKGVSVNLMDKYEPAQDAP